MIFTRNTDAKKLMDLVCTSDALTIADIVENILHRDDEDDFYLGAESLWVKSGESWTREGARELGWGCRYLVMMEVRVLCGCLLSLC